METFHSKNRGAWTTTNLLFNRIFFHYKKNDYIQTDVFITYGTTILWKKGTTTTPAIVLSRNKL
jgi:hypothetical protein